MRVLLVYATGITVGGESGASEVTCGHTLQMNAVNTPSNAAGKVTFTTTHFSQYAVGYNNISFNGRYVIRRRRNRKLSGVRRPGYNK